MSWVNIGRITIPKFKDIDYLEDVVFKGVNRDNGLFLYKIRYNYNSTEASNWCIGESLFPYVVKINDEIAELQNTMVNGNVWFKSNSYSLYYATGVNGVNGEWCIGNLVGFKPVSEIIDGTEYGIQGYVTDSTFPNSFGTFQFYNITNNSNTITVELSKEDLYYNTIGTDFNGKYQNGAGDVKIVGYPTWETAEGEVFISDSEGIKSNGRMVVQPYEGDIWWVFPVGITEMPTGYYTTPKPVLGQNMIFTWFTTDDTPAPYGDTQIVTWKGYQKGQNITQVYIGDYAKWL